MKKNKIHRVVIYNAENVNAGARPAQISALYAQAIERRLNKLPLTAEQKISVIDKIIEALKQRNPMARLTIKFWIRPFSKGLRGLGQRPKVLPFAWWRFAPPSKKQFCARFISSRFYSSPIKTWGSWPPSKAYHLPGKYGWDITAIARTVRY